MGIKGAICYERIPFIFWVLRGVLREVHGANAACFGRCRDIFLADQPTQKQVLIGETQFCDWGVGRGLAISPANLTPYPSEASVRGARLSPIWITSVLPVTRAQSSNASMIGCERAHYLPVAESTGRWFRAILR